MNTNDNKQPAKLSYFFGKGYKDLWNTIKESWSRNINSAKEKLHRFDDEAEVKRVPDSFRRINREQPISAEE